MKLFWDYLKKQRFCLLAFALFEGVFGYVFSLYEVNAEAFVYASLISLLIGSVFFAVGAIRFASRVSELKRLTDPLGAMIEPLPETGDTAQEHYARVISILRERCRGIEGRTSSDRTEMLDYFTRWVHQIKIPISVMRMELEDCDAEEKRSLSAELFRIEQYVELVLCYFRLEDSSSDLLAREISVDGAIRQSVRKYAPMFISKRLKLSYGGTELKAVTDEKWLGFIVEQLLSNAVKYTERGAVMIEVTDDGEISVSDTGSGIPADELPRIFERGYTGSAGRADRTATGLGLYLVKKACGRIGAEISVRSAVGKGTTVTVALPDERVSV